MKCGSGLMYMYDPVTGDMLDEVISPPHDKLTCSYSGLPSIHSYVK